MAGRLVFTQVLAGSIPVSGFMRVLTYPIDVHELVVVRP